MSIIEALACRLPVLLTPGCNFPEAAEAQAAIQVEPNAAAIEEGLRTLLSLSDAARRTMGNQGRRLVEQSYHWDLLAQKTLRLYHWLAHGGPEPEFVART
jgi:poly(glycerol-phosphate) alpha-glucosyltransferase